jgi:hypothetical protein
VTTRITLDDYMPLQQGLEMLLDALIQRSGADSAQCDPSPVRCLLAPPTSELALRNLQYALEMVEFMDASDPQLAFWTQEMRDIVAGSWSVDEDMPSATQPSAAEWAAAVGGGAQKAAEKVRERSSDETSGAWAIRVEPAEQRCLSCGGW